MAKRTPTIVAVALNPALDRILQVPNLEIGSHIRGKLVSIQPAGKAVNVARLLGALGTPCILTGFVGEADRDRFKRSFDETPVRVEMFEGRGITRENITLVDPERGVETHVRDVGFPVAPEDLERLRKKLAILAGKGSYVLFAGSLPPGMTADDFAVLLEACAEKGAYVAVDSSGPGLEALRGARNLWLVKPNRQELAEIAGREAVEEADIRATAESLRKRIEQVVVTLGPDGAYLFCREGAWRAKPHIDPAAVVKTVGSGDALLAGFVQGHVTGKGPAECLRLGVACGTASTLQMRAGLVNPYDVKACLENVELKALA
jgi:1-phosphofructokinase